ncbi:hypothetical protein [Pseudonocardia acidicola]|uniref:Alpha/beta hydrolase fold-3 domain-containing protein n=1 Tax=Pseudonocardia acidicola TaxID=2724939 RepID=A0ABX1SBF6_9PSEU|nr:hypothetical protein [Pseudonocardia acidicola]NMH98430.1 hypothetical protein [Pseudonocardia acidicola]
MARLRRHAREGNRHIEEQMTLAPARREMTEAYERTLTPGGGLIPTSGPVPGLQEIEAPGPAGTVPMRVIPPEGQPRGVYLHFHGGGFAMGAAHHHDVAGSHGFNYVPTELGRKACRRVNDVISERCAAA